MTKNKKLPPLRIAFKTDEEYLEAVKAWQVESEAEAKEDPKKSEEIKREGGKTFSAKNISQNKSDKSPENNTTGQKYSKPEQNPIGDDFWEKAYKNMFTATNPQDLSKQPSSSSYIDNDEVSPFSIESFDNKSHPENFGGVNFTGSNIVGNTIAGIARSLVGMHEEKGRNNFVPGLNKYLPSGFSATQGQAWCALFTTAVSHQSAKIFGDEFAADKFKNMFPKGAGVLDVKRQFEEAGAFISPSHISKKDLKAENLMGCEIFFSRKTKHGLGGHTGIVIGYDEKTGILTTAEGNLGKDGVGAVKIVKYNIDKLLNQQSGVTHSEGHNKTKFLGFGDLNKVIENKDRALYVYMQNKHSTENYASSNYTPPVPNNTKPKQHVPT